MICAEYLEKLTSKSYSYSTYCRRLVTFLRCPPACCVAGLGLLKRFSERKMLSTADELQFHFLACIVIVTKQWCDHYETMRYYAYVGGVPPHVLCKAELDVLIALDFDVSPSSDFPDELIVLPSRTLVTKPSEEFRSNSPCGLSPDTSEDSESFLH